MRIISIILAAGVTSIVAGQDVALTGLGQLSGPSPSSPVVAVAGDGSVLASGGGGGYDLEWHSIDGGGGTSAVDDLELCGTIGQPDAGPVMTGGDFELVGGFQVGGAAAVDTCPADIDDSGVVDFGDLLAVLAAWGECAACPEDLNGDGRVDFSDILAVLAAWGPCPSGPSHGTEGLVFQEELSR